LKAWAPGWKVRRIATRSGKRWCPTARSAQAPLQFLDEEIGNFRSGLDNATPLDVIDEKIDAIFEKRSVFTDALDDLFGASGNSANAPASGPDLLIEKLDSIAFVTSVPFPTDGVDPSDLGIRTTYTVNDADIKLPKLANSVVFDNNSNSTYLGGAGIDFFIMRGGSDKVKAGAGADYFNGGAGQDSVSGGAGDDFLVGEAGADTIKGDKGDDTLDGGSGRDVFQFGRGIGSDRIDFFVDQGTKQDDIIDLRPYGLSGPSSIVRSLDGDDLVLKLSGSDSIRIADYLFAHSAKQIMDDILI